MNYDTPIIIIDSAKASTKPQAIENICEDSFKEFPDTLFETLNNAERVDFSFLAQHYRDEKDDPLSIAYFESVHQRPEREAKKVRNGDKNKAQHERNEIIRLMEGLKGHEWLKVMGVSGITESKKKDYEPARQHFVSGCEMILEKFRTWKEEEKRRKFEKEQAKAESVAERNDGSVVSNGDPPDYSDVDASAARQLHEEAIAMSGPAKKTEQSGKGDVIPPSFADDVEPDLRSFFPNHHGHDATSAKLRRSGRSSGAWGHPVPEVPICDFDLPEELRNEDILKAHARKKRRERRISRS